MLTRELCGEFKVVLEKVAPLKMLINMDLVVAMEEGAWYSTHFISDEVLFPIFCKITEYTCVLVGVTHSMYK